MGEFFSDVRFGLRLLLRSPVFASTAILLLAIGISANTLIFSAMDALLLRPLPVPHPQELVRLVEVHSTGFETWDLPYGVCEALAARSASLKEILCEGSADVAFSDGASTERVRVHLVSPNFFASLGARPLLGRLLTPADEQAAAHQAVLSYEFWRRRFQGNPDIIGRGISLHGHTFTVAGVLPAGFNGLSVDTTPDVRVPASVERSIIEPTGDMNPKARAMGGQVFGRLRPGVPLQRANDEMEPLLRPIYDEIQSQLYPEEYPRVSRGPSNTRLHLESIANGVSTLRTQFSRGLEMLMAGVGLLLIMACANVAGLLLARSAMRSQEMSIRLALGASAGRLARQLFTESLILAVLGGALGLAITYAGLPLLTTALPPVRDRGAVIQQLAVHLDVDLRVLGFAISATLLTALLFGLSPALRSAGISLSSRLRQGRGATRKLPAHSLMMTAQVALCTLILIGAVLLVETLGRMRSMNPGFDSDHVVTFTIDPGLKNYKPEQARILSQKMLEQARTLPSVVSASVAGRGLMRGTGVKATFGAAGTHLTGADFLNSSLNMVTPGYFETMEMRLQAGRDFTWFDRKRGTGPSLVIVNQAFVHRFFPDRNPIGQRFGHGGPNGVATADNEIVGVVSNAKYRSLREPMQPTVYNATVDGFDNSFILHVRTHQRPEAVISPVREVLRSLDPELPFIEVKTLRDEVDASLWQERLLASLSSIFAGIAALLAGIGLYGALDYAVRSRTREIGVRVALGADPRRIISLLSGQVLLPISCGIAAGFLAYALSAAWIKNVLYDVRSWDPQALGLTLLLIATMALIAIAPPVWRAIRMDPASALRQE